MDNKSVNEMAKPSKLIFEIGDVVSTPRGMAIGGTNEALNDCSEREIADRIGNEIEIVSAGETRRVRVLDITITSSIADRKNIFILIPESNEDVHVASKVFSVE